MTPHEIRVFHAVTPGFRIMSFAVPARIFRVTEREGHDVYHVERFVRLGGKQDTLSGSWKTEHVCPDLIMAHQYMLADQQRFIAQMQKKYGQIAAYRR